MHPSHDPADETVGIQLPPTETGPVPVSIAHAEARWFGVPPPFALLVLVVAAVAAGIALVAGGRWPYGLILLGVAALLGALFLEVARRRPDSRLTRASADAAVGARDHARATVESLIARSSAVAETQRARTARAVIRADRREALLRLGEAAYRDDEVAAHDVRETLSGLDRAEEELEARLEARIAESDARVRSARLSVQQTMLVRPDGEATPPVPPQIPEPYPPPDEGTPPLPAPVPEPSPNPEPEEDSRRPAA